MNKIKITFLLALLMLIPSVHAVATLQVTAFSCTPNEVAIGQQFSCTATVQNTGDSTGSLTTATLFPDSSGWLEKSSYALTSNTNINSGASAEISFTGLVAKKQGDNGFARIMLDEVTDTYVADNSVEVNVIDVVLVVSSSSTSTTAGGSVDVTGQAIVGGNADITLTFSVVSGGCSIGSQSSSAISNNMADGQSTSHSWTVTMGTSEDCKYKITAKATSDPSGVATKTDTVTNIITCTACGGGSSSSSSSSSSGGGGGGGATTIQTKKSIILTSIDQNNPAKIENFHKELALRKIEISIYNRKLQVEITIDKLNINPVPKSVDGSAYKYLTIQNQLSDIDHVDFEFEVEKNWITKNNIDENKVYLYRYTENWDKLSTEIVSTNNTHIIYKATSPGLSYFAIAGEQKPAIQSINTSEASEESQRSETSIPAEEEKPSAPAGQVYIGKQGEGIQIPDYALIGIVLFVVLILGWFYYHGHKKLASK